MTFAYVSILISFSLTLTSGHILHTPQGHVSGTTAVSRNGIQYYAYLGIPYAEPPIGELRFQDPREPSPWSGIKIAHQYPPPCPQSGWGSGTVMGDEDCLYVNVFTPTTDNASELAVLVWIYGGGFVMGESGIYGADYIMDKNVVLVTFNYRVGALGFLYFDEQHLRGNYGMKDQVAALQWVKTNIRAFGGNPRAVTIAGSSAGGASVHWHMHSHLSRGLFHRAISQSGTARSIWSQIPRRIARKRATTFATLTGCYHESIEETAKCLKTIPVQEIVAVQRKFHIWNHNPLIFGVVVNKKYTETPFVTHSPWSKKAPLNPVPWMLGFTSDEGATMLTGIFDHNGTELEYLNGNRRRRIFPMLLMLEYYSNIQTFDDVSNLTDTLVRKYFADQPISTNTVTNLKNLIADSYTIYDTTESLMKHTKKTYFYVYDHVNKHSFAEFESNMIKEGLRAVHCDDLISLFKTTYFPQNLTDVDRRVSETMVELWTNFVIHGNPNGEPKSSQELWKPVSKESNELAFLEIKQQPEMKSWYWKDRYEFWTRLNLQHADSGDEYCAMELDDLCPAFISYLKKIISWMNLLPMNLIYP